LSYGGTLDLIHRGVLPAARLEAEAARVRAPTLVIYGADDRVVDARIAGRAAHAFGGARIVVLPRTGHLAHMEHPHLVAAEIEVLLAAAAQDLEARHTREFPLTRAG